MVMTQEVAMWNKVCKKTYAQKKETTKKRGIKKPIWRRRVTYDDSSWDTSLFCTRNNRSWYCHHLQMKEEAIQNLQQIEPKLTSLCTDTVTMVITSENVTSYAEVPKPDACCCKKKTYWYSA